MGHDEWKAIGAVLSGVAQLTAAAAAGWYFWLRSRRGHLIPNLSVSVACERVASADPATDWLQIRVALKKGERGTLTLVDAQARVTHETTAQTVRLWGCLLAESGADGTTLDWDKPEADSNNITPGEETELAVAARVPSGQACQIRIAVLARQYGQSYVGQWQASAVSLPISPEVVQGEAAGASRAFALGDALTPNQALQQTGAATLVSGTS